MQVSAATKLRLQQDTDRGFDAARQSESNEAQLGWMTFMETSVYLYLRRPISNTIHILVTKHL
jgi:hypothetical protein